MEPAPILLSTVGRNPPCFCLKPFPSTAYQQLIRGNGERDSDA